MQPLPRDAERAHPAVATEEWTFSWWSPDGVVGGVTGYRLLNPGRAWYWWALARRGEPLLHLVEFDIPRRADPMIAKAPEMWAQYTCEAPFEQWTVGNEAHAVLLDDPDAAIERPFGTLVPMASDLEWYATAPPTPIADGYEQAGVVHGVVELLSGDVELEELAAHRTHRWSSDGLPLWDPGPAVAHLGLRAGFGLPDGAVIDLVLTATGWRRRTPSFAP